MKEEKKAKRKRLGTPYIVAIVIAIVFLVALFIGIFLGITLENSGTIPDSPFKTSEFVDKIFPNGLWDFVIQLCAFVVLIVIVFFVGYKPMKKAIKARGDAIENDLATAKAKRLEAEAAASQKEVTIEEGKKEASRIVAEAKLEAETKGKAIVDEAKAQASLARKRADEEIAQAKEKSRQDAKEEIVDVAMAASSKLLAREVNEEDNARLVSNFIDEVNGGQK